MATTFTLISSTVLTSSVSSVSVNSIPQTYKDLMIYSSARNSANDRYDAQLTMNGITSGGQYASNYYEGYATSTVYGSVYGAANNLQPFASQQANGTTGFFSYNRLYIANYTKTTRKTASQFYCDPFNSTSTFYIGIAAAMLPAGALSSLTFTSLGGSFVAGSSFHVYGIN